IIIDPGIGFGKTVEHNVTILKELKKFKTLGCPILIGTSRKSFIGHLLGGIDAKERLEGTLATIGIAVQNGASIVRAHDVKETKRFLEVLNKFC
ncbi:MAG: dihydropteroate synthase, partial [Deltaproteobacteria bacterium]|nr:dihydropteroate synthase [Deltaproteobacteria bacterium]